MGAVKVGEDCNHYCPECEAVLVLNGSIVQRDAEIRYNRFFCDECDQSYVVVDGALAMVPFDAAGNKIEVYCKTCDVRKPFRHQMVWIVNELMVYDSYCEDCAIEKLRNSDFFTKKGKITKKNVREVALIHDFELQNQVLQDPEKREAALNTPAMRQFRAEIDAVKNK